MPRPDAGPAFALILKLGAGRGNDKDFTCIRGGALGRNTRPKALENLDSSGLWPH
jgi:hypothetical protein